MKHFNIKISGKVQGVFFRTSAKEQAVKLGITGFVQNEPDGTVYIEAEGKDEDLKEFLAWCKEGPELAEVERVDFEEEPSLKNFSHFECN